MKRGGGGSTPAGTHLVRLQRLGPDRATFNIQAIDAPVADVGINSLTVGRLRFRGISVFDVDWSGRLAVLHDLFPAHLARGQIKAKHFPFMLRTRRVPAFASQVESLLWRLNLA